MRKNLYKNIRKGIIAGVALVATGIGPAQAQMIADDVFLKGKFVEVGICNLGAFGSIGAAPEEYHSDMFDGSLGFVADPDMDGWDVGSPAMIGDYFLPGSPQEGWDIQVAGARSEAWRGNFPYGSFTGDLIGANTGYVIDGSKVIGNWAGNANDLAITQKTILDTNKVYFVCEVVLKNTGSTTINDIYYDRTVDPDNEEVLTGNFSTENTIVYQPDSEGGDDQKCLVSAVGLEYGSYLGLGAVDCRAKAYIIDSWDGLFPAQDLNDIYDGDTDYLTEKDDTYTDDVGIGIVWNIGDLAPGDSTTLAYAYILRQADLDSAFATLKPNWSYDGASLENKDTIVKCWGAEMDVEIAGGGAYVWGDWYPSTGLSNPSGRKNTITVGHDAITYRVIGTTPICAKSDTLYITIVPEGDSVIVNKNICQGETYDFLGNLKYLTGTYYDVLSTATGCDSVIQLNLTVNPLPDVTISARETQICEGEEALFTLDNPSNNTNYQWKRDGAAIPGATQHTYTASEASVYSITGTTAKGCTDDSRTITLTVNPKAEGSIVSISEQDVCIGDTVTVTSDNKPGYQYTWSPEVYFRYTSGNLNSSVNGIIPGTTWIYLKATNEYGCKDYDSVVVTAHPCCDIYIPTVFSPNNDGLNDEFLPKLRPGQKIIALQIFNRYGQMVYDNNNSLKGWNGRFNNKDDEAIQDVYMYRFVYTCTNGEVFETKGDITLVR